MADLHPPPPQTITNGPTLLEPQPPLINKRNRRPSVRLTSIGTTTQSKRNPSSKFRNNPFKRVRSNWGAVSSITITPDGLIADDDNDDQPNLNTDDYDNDDGNNGDITKLVSYENEENQEIEVLGIQKSVMTRGGFGNSEGGNDSPGREGGVIRTGVRTRGLGVEDKGFGRGTLMRTGVRTRGLGLNRREIENDEGMEIDGEESPSRDGLVVSPGRNEVVHRKKRKNLRAGVRTRGLGVVRRENENDGLHGGDSMLGDGGGKRRTPVRTRGLGVEREDDEEEEDGNEAEEEEEDEDEEEEMGRRDWRCRSLEDGIQMWLNGLGLGRYSPVFEIHEVDEEVLPMLTLDDLKDMGINAVGSRRKLYSAIQKLAKGFS